MVEKPVWRPVELKTPHLAAQEILRTAFEVNLEWQAHLEMLLYT
jgi:hypothetical protein